MQNSFRRKSRWSNCFVRGKSAAPTSQLCCWVSLWYLPPFYQPLAYILLKKTTSTKCHEGHFYTFSQKHRTHVGGRGCR